MEMIVRQKRAISFISKKGILRRRQDALNCPRWPKKDFFTKPENDENHPNLTRKDSKGPPNLKLFKTMRFIKVIIQHVENILSRFLTWGTLDLFHHDTISSTLCASMVAIRQCLYYYP